MLEAQPIVQSAPSHSHTLELLQRLLEVRQADGEIYSTSTTSHYHTIVEPIHEAPRIILQRLLEMPPPPVAANSAIAARAPLPKDDIWLLQSLLTTVSTPSARRMGPVILRSIESQRQTVLRDVRSAQAFDRLLVRAQQLMLVGAVLAGGYWFADGPLRDWLHAANKGPAAMAVARPRATAGAAAGAIAAQQSSIIAPAAGSARSEASTATPQRVEPTPGNIGNTQLLAGETFMQPRQGLLLESQISSPTPSPTREILPTPAEPTHLLIPSIGIDTPVVKVIPVDGVWEVAEYAAGYMYSSALAGEAGNMVMTGHLGLRGAVFLNLSALQPGADIFVDAPGWRYRYRVRGSQVVWPNQIEVLFPEETTTLTLITCTNWDTQRLVVKADLLGWEPFAAQ